MAVRVRDNDVDLLVFHRFAMLQRQNHIHPGDAALRHAARVALREPRFERVAVAGGGLLCYNDSDSGLAGVYVAAETLTPEKNYFEVEIVDTGLVCAISVGLAPPHYPLDSLPGWQADSIGYNADDGRIFKSDSQGRPFGPPCAAGDRIGCGINFKGSLNDDPVHPVVPVFFTKNGKEVGTVSTVIPPEGLNPAVGMHSEGEEVRLNLDAKWEHSDIILMSIDSCEEDWARLHDVRVNGQLLEYVGRGKSIIDVGLAQARHPLTTRYHYFEIQIVDPGQSCFIAIGLARRDYPKHRHPGWNKGSIAYHADDGKLFVGTGIGEHFGPECNKGDVMGCGILFPRDYRREFDASDVPDSDYLSDGGRNNFVDLDGGMTESESEDEAWWERPNAENGIKVQVFFTRNGKMVGKRDVRIPKGGFFPTVGMLSSDEKVRVDLRPLTG